MESFIKSILSNKRINLRWFVQLSIVAIVGIASLLLWQTPGRMQDKSNDEIPQPTILAALDASNLAAPLALGNYPNTTVAVGANATVTPSAAPAGTTSINVSTDSNFKGTFAEEDRNARESQQQLDESSSKIKLDQLTVHTPGRGKLLAEDLTFELLTKQSLLIMGASGTGKSSILRTIAGLWPGGPGSLERPALRELMFLPQRPYMVPGSLRDQLRYPDHDRAIDDEQMRQVIEKVNLADVLARVEGNLDSVIDWGNVLSLGEQQRVAIGRIFLRQPKFIFLDEATSALDEENQKRIYELIQQSGIGFISVGHRETLIPFHQRLLILQSGGTWEMEDVSTQGSEALT